MIEYDVPIPKAVKTRTYHRAVPLPRATLANMVVGSSVLIEGNARTAQNARTAAHIFAKQHGWKFASASEGNGIRIWRTE